MRQNPAESGIARSTLNRLVQRTRKLGQIACVPYGAYGRSSRMHPAFQECIRRLFKLPTKLSTTAIHEHLEMQEVAERLSKETGEAVKVPSYKQVRTAVERLKLDPEALAAREVS